MLLYGVTPWAFYIIIFQQVADDIEMNFRLDLCIYMDNSLVVFLEKFSFTSSFFFG